jgi:pimeloyl-ACP methyl ester carboxylesterase
VDAGGVRITYWRHGRGAPLVALHGVTDWGLDWARFARRAGDTLDCVLIDQRGHGYSDKPAEGYAYADFAADARHVIRHLGLDRPAVLGHSMGGGVALALAATYPETVGRLLLVDPAIRLGAEGGQRPDVAARRARLKQRQALGRMPLREQLKQAHPTWDDEDIASMVESTLLASPFVYDETRWPDPQAQAAQLRALRCPTLVVRGETARGAIIADDAARQIDALVPDHLARVTTIAGTGHVPQREAFALFVAVALPFLTGDSAPAAEGGSPACFAHLLDDRGNVRE